MLGVLVFATFGLAAARTSIRQLDFKNFSYPWSGPPGWRDRLEWQDGSDRKNVRLVNGRWRLDTEGGEEAAMFSGLMLEAVEFADVTDSGKEDAVVVLRFDTGGTQYSHYVYLYSFAAGKPTLLAFFHSGDRAYSGLYRVYGEGGKLVVELYDPERRSGDCCSSGFVRTRYRWHNGKFEVFGSHEFGTTEAPSRVPVTVFGTHI
jgi:hypothetical protein